MMKILIINGPNLNLLGSRETEVYGKESLSEIQSEVNSRFSNIKIEWFQSNIEGEIVDKIQEATKDVDGLIINPAAYSHTSIAILDALQVLEIPIIEVHLSNVYKREDFRSTMLTAKAADTIIAGSGKEGYSLALNYLIETKGTKS